jgi:acyl-CoA thioester hydrolase
MIVRLIVDFRAELFYPGVVDIGTRILRLGRASFTMAQAVFAGDSCAATAESTCVLVDTETRRAVPVPEALRRELLEM